MLLTTILLFSLTAIQPPHASPATAPGHENMALIPGGTFQMGDLFNEGRNDEKPVHTVTLDTFYLSKTEVTFDEYDAFCTATGREEPYDYGWGRGGRPLINVSWYDAVEYCNWLSVQGNLTPVYTIDKTRQDPNNLNSGDKKKWIVTADWRAKGYRLPTEAEWEFAAREGGKKLRFGHGRDTVAPSEINFDARADYQTSFSIVGEYRRQTVPVDQLDANSLGLRHMSGNVSEMCWDWYDRDHYSQSDDTRNPSGPGAGQHRVCRGGSWIDEPGGCRTSIRGRGYPDPWNSKNYLVGFRVARRY